MRWALLFSGFLALGPFAMGLDREGAVQRLRDRLELAAKPLPYLLITPEATVIYVKGIPVKRLPICGATGLSQGKSRASEVVAIVPVTPVPEILLRADEPDFDSTRPSPEKTVGVKEMPGAFLVELKDGSFIYVRAATWQGVLYWLREKTLELRLTGSYLGSLLRGNLSASLIRLEMESFWARRLFWTLQEGSGVIY